MLPVYLGGGCKYFLFSSRKFGEDSHFDEHIFQRGWFNHQLDIFGKASDHHPNLIQFGDPLLPADRDFSKKLALQLRNMRSKIAKCPNMLVSCVTQRGRFLKFWDAKIGNICWKFWFAKSSASCSERKGAKLRSEQGI